MAVPVNSTAPTIAGTPSVGHVMRCWHGLWTNTPTSYGYQWKRAGVDISSATADTYTLVSADNTNAITCNVTATNGSGTSGATASDSVTCGASASVTWTPGNRQVWEPDTILLLDPGQEEQYWTDSRHGWVDNSGWDQSLALCNPWRSGAAWTVAGKYRQGVQFSATALTFLFMPGCWLPTDSFTVEFFVKCSQNWATEAGAFGERHFLAFGRPFSDMYFRMLMKSTGVPKIGFTTLYDSREIESAGTPLSGVWVNMAATWDGTTLSFYVDGTLEATQTGFPAPPMWTPGVRMDREMDSTNFVLSDLRVSRGCRIPATPVTVTAPSAITVTDTPTGDTTNRLLRASVGNPGTDSTLVASVLEAGLVMSAVGKLETACPIKAGGTDSDYPVAGQSGSYSYNMGPANHLFDYLATIGIDTVFLGFGNCPQILGGSVAPRSFADCADPTVLGGDGTYWAPEVPSNMANYAKICADFYYHLTTTYPGIEVRYVGTTNEPDSAHSFWEGTQTELFDFYDAIVTEIRALNPDQLVGGPQLSDFQNDSANWIQNMITYCGANATPLDFICFHLYSDHAAFPWSAQKRIEGYATSASIPTPGIIIGELNWSLDYRPNGTVYPYGADNNFMINDWGGSLLATSLVLHQQLGIMASFYFSMLSGSSTAVGDDGLVMFDSASKLPWAPGNVERIMKLLE